jgi:hypothetical protein
METLKRVSVQRPCKLGQLGRTQLSKELVKLLWLGRNTCPLEV